METFKYYKLCQLIIYGNKAGESIQISNALRVSISCGLLNYFQIKFLLSWIGSIFTGKNVNIYGYTFEKSIEENIKSYGNTVQGFHLCCKHTKYALGYVSLIFFLSKC